MNELLHYFENQQFIETMLPGDYQPQQLGAQILSISGADFNLETAEIVIVGCGEWRGSDANANYHQSADSVREELYKMYYWHPEIKIADIGNIMQGETVDDTRAALLTVLYELHAAGKVVVLIGGSHDLTLQQYEVFKKARVRAVGSVADMLIDLDESEAITDRSFLMNMLTETPNYIAHYNHMAFQTYYAHPKMLETLDKLRFDFYRLGAVREKIEEMEPVLRGSNFFSIDMNVMRHCNAPCIKNVSPNGLDGEEICQLTRFAGMSGKLSSLGIYSYDSRLDPERITARLLSQMIWYFIDGYSVRKTEAELSNTDEFITFHIPFTEYETVFMKSKRTNRWWMKLPNEVFIPCSYNDYELASSDIMPERWLREQERLV